MSKVMFNFFFFSGFCLCSSLSGYAQLATFPFQLKDKNILIKAKVNNSDSLDLIFDTGSTATLIDSLTAEQFGIGKENRQVVETVGSGGSRNYLMATQQEIQLPQHIRLSGIDVILMNFSKLESATGKKMKGIIGYDLLSKYVTSFDFDRKCISLFHQIKEVDTTGYTGIPFEFSKGIQIPRFPVTITTQGNKQFTGKVMFDSGASLSLFISAPFKNFHHLNTEIGPSKLVKGRGLNESTTDQKATIKSMHFYGFHFGQMGISLAVDDQAEKKDGYLGLLGLDIIRRFNVIIDYPNHKIFLKPNKYYHTPF